jgi:hypothetical protein
MCAALMMDDSNMEFAFEHIGLPARTPASLRDWYQRVLGAECVFGDGQAPPFLLRLPGGVMIEVYGRRRRPGAVLSGSRGEPAPPGRAARQLGKCRVRSQEC